MHRASEPGDLRFTPTGVPFAVFTDPEVYRQEQSRIFRGATWNFLGLAAELPRRPAFKTTWLGDLSVVVTRDGDDHFHAWVNRCAHCGATVCRMARGEADTFSCACHHGSYDVAGNLRRVGGGGPDDFWFHDGSLTRLRVERIDGLIFGTLDPTTPPLADFLGETARAYLHRLLARPVEMLGVIRQMVSCNWKLYAENVRDPYHASLLHLFYHIFGLNRVSQQGGVALDEVGWHHVLYAYRDREDPADRAAVVKAYARPHQAFALADASLLATVSEHPDGITQQIQTIFPSLVLQQIGNTLAVRHIVPKGPESFELIWLYLGYVDDDPHLRQQRLKQANLIGPAGLVSMEDAEVGQLVQRALRGGELASSVMAMGGETVASTTMRITEASVRGFWRGYCGIMGIPMAGNPEASSPRRSPTGAARFHRAEKT